MLAAILELAFAYVVGPVDEMQLMLDIRLFKQSPKPDALFRCVAGKIEHDGHAFGKWRANVR